MKIIKNGIKYDMSDLMRDNCIVCKRAFLLYNLNTCIIESDRGEEYSKVCDECIENGREIYQANKY